MRLLNVESLKLVEFDDDEVSRRKYITASHRWIKGGETNFDDFCSGRNVDTAGYKKVEAFAEYIKENIPTIEWLWIDTCCINKHSAAELSEAVNSMFRWYRNAELCLAYIADVEDPEDKYSFGKSEWFKRGWTLQELLAPRSVVFLTRDWQVIGSKGVPARFGRGVQDMTRLEEDIARITEIPVEVLRDYETSLHLPVDKRLKWMEGRITTREEDKSYALYGIFGVTPGANYGERHDGARQRLLAAIHYQDDVAAQQAARFQEIVDWLSPSDPWVNHKSARQRHEPQTGTWLLNSNNYQAWKAAAIRHLWLFGKAGCGKTVLCSTVIEDVRQYCENATNAGYAVFYFSFSDNRKSRFEDLLLSLVAQLGWRKPGVEMLQQAYEKPNRSMPGLDYLEKILLSCVESYDEAFILLDALDECPEDSDVRQEMLEWIIKLAEVAPNLRIFVTSRELPDIRESMAKIGAQPVPVATNSVDTDICKYVRTRLSLDHRLSRLDETTKVLIQDTISSKADGMFRWAYCQLQELKKLKSTRPKFVKEALFSLPTTLDETYERILLGIDDGLRMEALKLLRWIAYAKSPLSLGELVDAAVIDPTGDGTVDLDDRGGLDDTIEILSGLVTTDEGEDEEEEERGGGEGGESRNEDISNSIQVEVGEVNLLSHIRQQFIIEYTKVRLAHFSVKEYLESKRILQSGAEQFHLEPAREHEVLSKSCLAYVMHYSTSSEKLSTKKDSTLFPLVRYAAESWFYHSALKESTDATHETRLLCSDTALRDWLFVYQPDDPTGRNYQTPRTVRSSLYYASFVGLVHVVGKLLKLGADVSAQGETDNAALLAASRKGYEKVVQMLLEAGADVNAPGRGYKGTALQAASFNGYEKVVQMLLEAGADVNIPGRGYKATALQEASSKGHEKVVQMLLEAGADINTQGEQYNNTPQAASLKGHEKVAQMLLDSGPFNAQGFALQAASSKGYEKIVQMLLEAGADVNAQGGQYNTALQAASVKGCEKVVQMLLESGADVNAEGGQYNTALQAASLAGRAKIVQMLLEAGADVNAPARGDQDTALQRASLRGNQKVVQMLLEAGADVNAQRGQYTALQIASRKGHEKVVQMLLDAGADVIAKGGQFIPRYRRHYLEVPRR